MRSKFTNAQIAESLGVVLPPGTDRTEVTRLVNAEIARRIREHAFPGYVVRLTQRSPSFGNRVVLAVTMQAIWLCIADPPGNVDQLPPIGNDSSGNPIFTLERVYAPPEGFVPYVMCYPNGVRFDSKTIRAWIKRIRPLIPAEDILVNEHGEFWRKTAIQNAHAQLAS